MTFHVLPLSAASAGELRVVAEAFRALLGGGDPGASALSDVAFTAAISRPHLAHRLAVVASSREDAAARLAAWLRGEPSPGVAASSGAVKPGRRLAFVFSGQGSQWAGMGAELLAEPSFREAWERVAARAGAALDPGGDVARTEVAQPLVFALQVGLAALLRGWGLRPDAVVGHSVGEIAAAHVAGAIGLDDAVHLVVSRGRLMEGTAEGRMLAAELAPDDPAVLRAIAGGATLAAINGPRSVVLSAPVGALGAIRADLPSARELRGTYAFHGPAMDGPAAALALENARLRAAAAPIPIASTALGRLAPGTAFDPAYWALQARGPVRFADAILALLADGHEMFVELGPHPTLGLAIEAVARAAGRDVAVTSTLRRGRPDREALLGALAELYCHGRAIDWDRLHGAAATLVALPEVGAGVGDRDPWAPYATGHPLLGDCVLPASPSGLQVWQARLERSSPAYLADHEVLGDVLVPAAAFVELALAASGATALADVRFHAPLALAEGRPAIVQIARDGAVAITVHAWASPGWKLHASARVEPDPDEAQGAPEPAAARPGTDSAAVYADLARRGLVYGDAFRVLDDVSAGGGVAVARLAPPADVEDDADRHRLHPALLDAALQLLLLAAEAEEAPFVPVAIGSLALRRPGGLPVRAVARVSAPAGEGAGGDVWLLDAADEVVAEAHGVVLRKLARAASPRVLVRRWVPAPRAAAARAGGACLVLADRGGAGAALGAALTDARMEATVVPAGASIEGALRAGPARGGWRAIVDLRSLDAPPEPSEESWDRGPVAALELVQAIARLGLRDRPRLFLVTRGAEAAAPAAAALWGLGATLTHEMPELSTTLVDLDPSGAGDALLAAAIAAPDAEDRIALRAGGRLALRLVREEVAFRAARVRAGRTYLVTGGLGGLGLEVARWLADRGATSLALLARRPPDAAAAAVIAGLAAGGVAVRTIAADVGIRADVDAAIAAIDREGPPLGGVVHSAAVVDDRVVLREERGRMVGPVMRSKALGAHHLHAATSGRDLDFFVLFSSVASLLGWAGQASYAAANAYLDALARHRRAAGAPALSIQWGPWESVGLAARAGIGARAAARGIAPIATAEGLRRLGALLDSDLAEAGAFDLRLDAYVAHAPRLAGWPLLSSLAPEPRERSATQGELDLRGVALEDAVRGLVARVIGAPLDDVGLGAELRALGVDSLRAVELRNHLRAELGAEVDAGDIFALGRVGDLVAPVSRVLGLAPRPPEEAPPAPFVLEARGDEELDSVRSLGTDVLRRLLAEEAAEVLEDE